MVAAATTVTFEMNAQDASVETQAIGVVSDTHALVNISYYLVITIDDIVTRRNTRSILKTHYI